MNNILKQTLQYGLSLLAGVALLWFVFRNENLENIWEEIKGADYRWVFITYVLTLIAHFARAFRWNLLLKQTGHRVPNGEAFLALLAGYGANLVLPRMGEIVRCTVLKRRQNVTFDTSIGTVVAERLFDLICLIILLTATILWQHDVLLAFIQKMLTGFVDQKSSKLTVLYCLLVILVLCVFVILLLRKKIVFFLNTTEHPFLRKIKGFLVGARVGFLSIIHLPNQTALITSTVIIWVSYYFMAYLIFFSLPATSAMAPGAGMAILVMGAFGIAAPVQGGIGAYHWIVSQTLLLYGIQETDGKTYATLAHASQMLLTIAFSIVSFAIIVLYPPNKHDRAENSIPG